MSELTAELLTGRRKARKVSPWRARFGAIADRLVEAYGRPTLGNYDDPVREIFYIVLSAKTADAQYRQTDAALSARFPTVRALAAARLPGIVKCIRGGGLANKKASQVKRIARALDALGDDPAAALRALSAHEAYAFLTHLPGVGPKSAFCVMMCSLGFDVFPVDVNVSRIATRLGAAPVGLKHYEYQKRLPALVPPGRCKDLHVGLVVHGRTVCLPRAPRCGECRIAQHCRVGRMRAKRARATQHGGAGG